MSALPALANAAYRGAAQSHDMVETVVHYGIAGVTTVLFPAAAPAVFYGGTVARKVRDVAIELIKTFGNQEQKIEEELTRILSSLEKLEEQHKQDLTILSKTKLSLQQSYALELAARKKAIEYEKEQRRLVKELTSCQTALEKLQVAAKIVQHKATMGPSLAQIEDTFLEKIASIKQRTAVPLTHEERPVVLHSILL